MKVKGTFAKSQNFLKILRKIEGKLCKIYRNVCEIRSYLFDLTVCKSAKKKNCVFVTFPVINRGQRSGHHAHEQRRGRWKNTEPGSGHGVYINFLMMIFNIVTNSPRVY